MKTFYNFLLERTDIEKSHIISEMSIEIINGLKTYINNKIDNYKNLIAKSGNLDYLRFLQERYWSFLDDDIKNPFIKINLSDINFNSKIRELDTYFNIHGITIIKNDLNDGGGDYYKTYITLYNTLPKNIIELKDSVIKENYPKAYNIFNTIDWKSLSKSLQHELVHAYDDTNYSKSLYAPIESRRYRNRKILNTIDKQKKYFKSNPEYNAYFLSAVNYLQDEIDKNEYVITDFPNFKNHFIELLNYKNNFYDNTSLKIKNKFNKRMYFIYEKFMTKKHENL